MSTPGWYPDPGGRSGHYRLWDGHAWGLSTTDDPPGGGAPSPPPPRRPRVGPWILAGVVLLVVLAVVTALVVRSANRPIVDQGVSPTASGGGDTAPAATPSAAGSPSPTPTLSPTPDLEPSAGPSSDESASPAACPVGNPFARQDYRPDARVHGGALSFPRQPGWDEPGPQASAFTWAYDLGETDVQLTQSRYAAFAVGAVSVADGFEDPRSAAELAMRCTVASALYSNVSSRTDLVDEQTTVDGYRAWTLRSQIRTYDARTSFVGDTVQITVVDLDSAEALAFFWGSAPIGDEAFTARLDSVARRLRVG